MSEENIIAGETCSGRQKDDTAKLLKECEAGAKMAIASFEDVQDNIKDKRLADLISESKKNHEKLTDEIHTELQKMQEEDKEPGTMAKGMSWIKTNVKLTMDESDATVADLMTDGCDMGIKSLRRYLNQYENADDNSKEICHQIIDIEEELRKSLQQYL